MRHRCRPAAQVDHIVVVDAPDIDLHGAAQRPLADQVDHAACGDHRGQRIEHIGGRVEHDDIIEAAVRLRLGQPRVRGGNPSRSTGAGQVSWSRSAAGTSVAMILRGGVPIRAAPSR